MECDCGLFGCAIRVEQSERVFANRVCRIIKGIHQLVEIGSLYTHLEHVEDCIEIVFSLNVLRDTIRL